MASLKVIESLGAFLRRSTTLSDAVIRARMRDQEVESEDLAQERGFVCIEGVGGDLADAEIHV